MVTSAQIQHVNKASSDELLRKFAELGSESGNKASRKRDLQVVKRRKRSCRGNRDEDNYRSSSKSCNSLVERKSLLPQVNRRSIVLGQIGIGRIWQIKTKDVKNKSLIGTIGKTWRKTLEGASKVFIERHYNRHKRLINDVV